MELLERCSQILKSNINDLLARAENPEKMINLMLQENRESLAEVKSKTAEVMANETAAKRELDQCKAAIEQYQTGAINALKAGNDEDARKLLSKKQTLEQNCTALQANYDAAHADAENVRAAYDKLVQDIQSLESRAAALKASAATAKAKEKMGAVATGIKKAHGSDAFDRMEQKINKQLDKANAMAELDKQGTADEDLLKKYTTGAAPSSVDDELARLKAQLAGGTE